MNSEGTVPSDLSTAAGTLLHLARNLASKILQHWQAQLVHHHESQDCSDSESNAAPPVEEIMQAWSSYKQRMTILQGSNPIKKLMPSMQDDLKKQVLLMADHGGYKMHTYVLAIL